MDLTVYRQSSKKRPDGTIVYKGEDALPFVGNQIFFVADGLGGAAAIRHQHINLDLFERDKLMDTLFKGVYEEYDDEKFVKYVTDSFFELFAVKDCYTENINNIKKSGYFASRIVAAIFLHEIIYNDGINPLKQFEEYNSMETQEGKEEVLKKLGDYFAKKIRDDMNKIAKNANLYYESSYSGLALLGSTLCATIYHETEDAVEAFYLTAGDSRPYIWTENEGLCQIVEDQEGKDGGMTNYIKANEGEIFSIRCNYMRFRKPCVLFNASDGCFDSGYFLSQMAFERLILEKAVSSSGIDTMSKSLHETFFTYGKHDDSSTIAMKIFGYESFPLFQESASRRLVQIQEEYLSKLPDILEHDYISEYNECATKLSPRLASLKSKFEDKTAIQDFCVEQMRNGNYPPYEAKMRSIDEKIYEAKRQINRVSKRIENIVGRNYVRFIPLMAHKESRGEKRAISKILSIDKRYQQQSDDYMALINGYRSDFEKTTKQLMCVIEQMSEIGVPSDFSAYDDISISIIEECNQSLKSLFDFFYSVKVKKQGAVRQLTQLRKEYVTQNLKLAAGNEEDLQKICKMVISGSVDLSIIRSQILQDDYEDLKRELVKIQDANKLIVSLNKDEKVKALQECREAYWNKNYANVIAEVVSDLSINIPNELRNEARVIINELSAQTDELKNKAELQSKLFRLYDDSYGHFLGGKE